MEIFTMYNTLKKEEVRADFEFKVS